MDKYYNVALRMSGLSDRYSLSTRTKIPEYVLARHLLIWMFHQDHGSIPGRLCEEIGIDRTSQYHAVKAMNKRISTEPGFRRQLLHEVKSEGLVNSERAIKEMPIIVRDKKRL